MPFPAGFGEKGGAMILGGVALLATGAGLTWLLWEAGWIASATLLLLVMGVGLIASGFAAIRSERRARAEWPRVAEAEAEIVDTMLQARAQGVLPYDWLLRNGFQHRGIRKYLMERYRRAATRQPPPGAPRRDGREP